MARNLIEIEQQILQLEEQKKLQLESLKQDVAYLTETMHPLNIAKRGITKWINKNTGSQLSIKGNLLGILGTFMIEDLLLRDEGLIKRTLGRILSSTLIQDILKGDDSWIKRNIQKLAGWVKNKSNNNFNTSETPSTETANKQ